MMASDGNKMSKRDGKGSNADGPSLTEPRAPMLKGRNLRMNPAAYRAGGGGWVAASTDTRPLQRGTMMSANRSIERARRVCLVLV